MWLSLIYSNTVQHNQKHSNPCGFCCSFGDKQKAVMTCFSPLHLMDIRIVFPQKRGKFQKHYVNCCFWWKMRTCYCGKLLFCGPCFSPPQPNIHRTSSAEKKQVIKKYKQLIPLTLSDNVICREHTAYRLLINYPTLLYITLSRCRCREAKRIVRCPALPICIGICFQQVDPTVA